MIERSLLMKTNSKKFSIKDWFEKNKLYILAFVLPILSMLIVYYFKNIFPFGDQMYLRSDCYHQYTPYLEILQQKLKDGEAFLYLGNWRRYELYGGCRLLSYKSP